MMVQNLEINLLGRMEACWNDQAITLLEPEAKLLAWLALHRNQDFKDQELAPIFFPASTAGDGGRSSVGKLKKSLWEPLCKQTGQFNPEAQKERLDYDSFFNTLLGAASIDVAQFDKLNKRPDVASKLEALRIAVRGPFLQGWEDAWIVSERERIEKKIALLHLDLKRSLPNTLTGLLAQKEYETGCHLVEQALALDLQNDPVWSNLLAEKQANFQVALHEQRTQFQADAKQPSIANAGLAARLNSGVPSAPCSFGSLVSVQKTEPDVRQAEAVARQTKSIAANGKRGVIPLAVALLLLLTGAIWFAANPHTPVPVSVMRDETQTWASPEAARLYQKGRALWESRSRGELQQALKLFQRAHNLSPQQASCCAGLADTYSMRCFYGYAAPKDALRQALFQAQEALRLSRTPDEKTEAYASLAFAELLAWKWDFAENDFKTAIEVGEKKEGEKGGAAAALGRAYQWRSLYLLACGKGALSQREIENALHCSPHSKAINLSSGRRYYYAQDYKQDFKEAIGHFKEMLKNYPNDGLILYWLGLSYEGRGDSGDARASLEEALKSNSGDSNVLAALGHLYAMSGDTDNAQGILNKLLLPGSAYVSPVAIATIYMGLYDHAATASEKTRQEAALKHYLSLGRKDHASDMLLLRLYPRFASIQHKEWFLSLMRQVLPAQ